MTTTEGRREGPEPSEKELTEELLRVLADLDALETSVVEQLADGADPDTYLAWARTTFPDLAPGLFEASGKPQDQVACALARKLWNVMPVEANGFEPVLMPDADPDALCPCGSSRTYGGRLQQLLARDPDHHQKPLARPGGISPVVALAASRKGRRTARPRLDVHRAVVPHVRSMAGHR